MNEVKTLTTYHETITTNNQLFKLHTRLRAKNFEQVADGYWTEIWENPATEERVILERKN